MTIRVTIFWLLMILTIKCVSQNSIVPLKIGDPMPLLSFNELLNSSSGKIDFSDYVNKLVILDFWNRGCVPCIKAIPKMQKLQDEFNGQIQVILVTENTKEQLKGLLQNSPIIRSNKLPGIIGDTILNKLFPHEFEPFHIWVNKGKVIAITRDYNATSDHIKDIINGKDVHMATFHNREDLNLTMYSSLFQSKNANLFSNFDSYSVLTGPLFVGTITGPLSDSDSHKLTGYRFIDVTRLTLFRAAYHFSEPDDRIILNVNDKSQFYQSLEDSYSDQWYENHIFCYEMKFPILKNMPNDEKKDKILDKVMQQDLERFFGIQGTVETRMMTCWILIQNEKKSTLNTRNGSTDVAIMDNKIIIKNANLDWLREELMRFNLWSSKVPPIINETNYKGNVDLEINASLSDRQELSKALKNYGLDLIEDQRKVKVLILTESNK